MKNEKDLNKNNLEDSDEENMEFEEEEEIKITQGNIVNKENNVNNLNKGWTENKITVNPLLEEEETEEIEDKEKKRFVNNSHLKMNSNNKAKLITVFDKKEEDKLKDNKNNNSNKIETKAINNSHLKMNPNNKAKLITVFDKKEEEEKKEKVIEEKNDEVKTEPKNFKIPDKFKKKNENNIDEEIKKKKEYENYIEQKYQENLKNKMKNYSPKENKKIDGKIVNKNYNLLKNNDGKLTTFQKMKINEKKELEKKEKEEKEKKEKELRDKPLTRDQLFKKW